MEEFEQLKEKHRDLMSQTEYARIRSNCSKIVIHKNDENFDEAVGDICLDGDEDELENGEPDRLLIGDICYVVVHQGGYRRDVKTKVPEGDFLCQRGMNILFNKKITKGKYCSDNTGAIVKTPVVKQLNKKTGRMKKQKDPIWAHISGVNWLPEVWYDDDNDEEIISKLDGQFKGLKGQIGKQTDYVGIQGDFKDGGYTFHVRGGMKTGLIKADMDDQTDTTDGDRKLIFGKKHQTEGVELLKQKGGTALVSTVSMKEEPQTPETEERRMAKVQQKLEELKLKTKTHSKKPKTSKESVLTNGVDETLSLFANNRKIYAEGGGVQDLTKNMPDFAKSGELETENSSELISLSVPKWDTTKYIETSTLIKEKQLSLLKRLAFKIKSIQDTPSIMENCLISVDVTDELVEQRQMFFEKHNKNLL